MNINSKNLLATKIAAGDKECRSALKNLHFTGKYIEATDGPRAIRITYPEQIKQEDLPETIKTGLASDLKDFQIPVESAKDIKFYKVGKNSPLNWMTQAYIDVEATNSNGSAFFTSLNLESKSTQEIKKSEEKWPNVEGVFPKGKPILQIAVNPNYLSELSEIAGKIDGSKSNPCMLMNFYGPLLPIRIEAVERETHQKMDGLLIPMRWVPEAFGYPSEEDKPKIDIRKLYTDVRKFARTMRSERHDCLDLGTTHNPGFVAMLQKVFKTL